MDVCVAVASIVATIGCYAVPSTDHCGVSQDDQRLLCQAVACPPPPQTVVWECTKPDGTKYQTTYDSR